MSLIFAFVAGLVTVLSPCVLPLLPILLANSSLGGRARPIGLMIGFAVFFTAVTLTLSLLVRQIGLSPDIHRITAAILFILFGLILLLPWLKDRVELALSKVTSRFGQARQTNGFWGGLVSGMGLGLAWTPCVGPIMASVITLAMNQETTLHSAAMAFAFSLGSALPMAGFIIAGRSLHQRIGFLRRHAGSLQKLMGALILIVGLAIWFGFDRDIQILLLKAFPNWESSLTGWEH